MPQELLNRSNLIAAFKDVRKIMESDPFVLLVAFLSSAGIFFVDLTSFHSYRIRNCNFILKADLHVRYIPLISLS